MHVTMVKKRLQSGAPCNKCKKAEELLRARAAWDRIDRIVWAVEDDPDSEGMQLARRYGIEAAPFFVVDDDNGESVAYASVLRLMQERLEPRLGAVPPALAAADVEALGLELAARPPRDIVRFALQRFGRDCALAFSGAEDVVLIDMASETGLPFSVFCLDTGRLHPETYAYLDRVRVHYALDLELFAPDPAQLQPFVRRKGLFSFYEDGHKECCAIRKVEPLRRALSTRRAWMTGQRRDQSPSRAQVNALEIDPAFSGCEGALIKLNPLASWSSEQVWSYIRERGVPYNPLHERGFLSIGCEPCTRPTHPGQHEREGRWWWEATAEKECGLHAAPQPARPQPPLLQPANDGAPA
jgi:phosphoadenosine phosphosulfate reductase